jgi:peptidoglycan/LPS O-acetylase OafA/YrhL
VKAVSAQAAPVPGANPEQDKVQAYPLFDWLRFVLASVVVIDHAGFAPVALLRGPLAVQVFFALSGWLIGSILLRTAKTELPHFFFNRATRIWIPYAVAILLLYGLAAAREGVDFFWVKYLVMDVTFTHQLFTFFPAARFEMPLDGSGNQFWSIAVEEQFYLFAPLLMLFVPRGRTILLWAPIALATLLLGWNAAPVSLGVCAAILHRDYGIADRNDARIAAIALALLFGIAILAGIGPAPIITPLFAVSLVVALAWPGARQPVALVAGGLSYPLYLNHWIGAFAANFIARHVIASGKAITIILAYLFAVVLALVLYWLIDRQVQLRRNRWYTPALGRRLGAIAYGLVAVGLVSGYLMHRYGPEGAVPAGHVEPVR